jgi:hypothetical protein
MQVQAMADQGASIVHAAAAMSRQRSAGRMADLADATCMRWAHG